MGGPMTTTTSPALTVAALRDILAQAEDTAIVWLDIGSVGANGFRVLTDEARIVPEDDADYSGDLVIGTRTERWHDVLGEREKVGE